MGRLEYGLFCFLGVGSLLPWNAFITVSDYFQDRLCGSKYKSSFESAFGMAYNIANIITLLLIVRYQDRFSDKQFVLGSTVSLSLVFLLTTMVVLIQVDSQDFFFTFSVVAVALSGILAGPYLTGLTRFAGSISPIYVASVFTGQAVSGVVVSIISLFTTGLSPMKEDFCRPGLVDNQPTCPDFFIDWSAFCYFTIVVLSTIAGGWAYVYLEGLKSLRTSSVDADPLFENEFQVIGSDDSPGSADAAAINTDEIGITNTNAVNNNEIADNDSSLAQNGLHRRNGSREYNEVNETSRISEELVDTEVINLKIGTWAVIHRIRYTLSAVFLTFAGTLSVFPALTALTKSTSKCESDASRFSNDLFIPTLFLVFNVGDLLGRIITGRILPQNEILLLALSLARFAFVPLFFLVPMDDASITPMFRSDFFTILLTFVYALSNGYIGSATMVLGPQLLPNGPNRDFASTIMLFGLTMGLLIGSFGSLISVKITGA